MSELTYIYRTTDAVKCEWCGAEPGQSCHDDRGPILRHPPKFHTCRVDPTSEPIGIEGPERPGYGFREILPIPAAPRSGEAT